MNMTKWPEEKQRGLFTPSRNRYFYGKLLDVYHFDLETQYHSALRHLHNRLVTGYGVVCGLDVRIGEDDPSIIVTSGMAIDKCGREIIVPCDTAPQSIPPELLNGKDRQDDHEEDQVVDEKNNYPNQRGETGKERRNPGERSDMKQDGESDWRKIQVHLCYHECETDPTPVLSTECHVSEVCSPGSINERYRIIFLPGHAPPVDIWECHIPDAISRGELDYSTLVKMVTEMCPTYDECDVCVPLANISVKVSDGDYHCHQKDIDITVRPLVYSNYLLFYLINSMLYEPQAHRRRK